MQKGESEKNNSLPWRLKNEMNYFTRITSNVKNPNFKNVVVIGRKTWESIPKKYRPLSGRINIILSKTLCSSDVPDDVVIKPSLDDALAHISTLSDIEDIYICGGCSVYEEAVKSPLCDRIYLTHVDGDFGCDAFFPEFDESKFKLVSDPAVPEGIQEERGIKYQFHLYQREL